MIYFDLPPGRTWAEKGGLCRIRQSQKHSLRMTAMMTIRADGGKLQILFFVRDQPGCTIYEQEVPLYPVGHLYAVQEKAWMDERVCRIYVLNCLRLPY